MKDKISIKKYDEARDADAMFALMKQEGDWGDCCNEGNEAKYKLTLNKSVAFVLYCGDTLCGFVRVRDDSGFGVYIHDLLVGKKYRGSGYGKMLIEFAADGFAGSTVYVLSDVDDYYNKQGYVKKVGSVITVREKK